MHYKRPKVNLTTEASNTVEANTELPFHIFRGELFAELFLEYAKSRVCGKPEFKHILAGDVNWVKMKIGTRDVEEDECKMMEFPGESMLVACHRPTLQKFEGCVIC